MAAPSALVLRCDTCGVVPHRVLRGRVSGKDEIVFEGVVRCSQCGAVRSTVTREPRPIQVPLIVSFLEASERTSLECSPDERIEVGQEIELGDNRLEVTAIEVKGRRMDGAVAKEVSTLWAKRTDQIRVKFSVNKGNRTVPHEVLAAPDEEFEVGEIVDLGRDRAVVHHIRTRHRTMREGRVRADEIVRMYGRVVRERTGR
ncbi:MAG TPA: HVO_0476 family zinc finger protein [Thermoplasmata archaeon]